MKPFAIVASIVIIFVCLVYALNGPWETQPLDSEPRIVALEGVGSVVVSSEISSVRITTADTAELTARLSGNDAGLFGPAVLDVTNANGQVRVRAHRQRGLSLFNIGSLALEITLPNNYSGTLDVSASAGSVRVEGGLRVQSLRLKSSAGSVNVDDVIAEKGIEISSSAGSVRAGKLAGADINLHSSAGSIRVDSCEAAGLIRLQSSAGSIDASDVSGAVDAHSSASSVTLRMRDVKANVKADSSAGGVRVSIPADAAADVDLSTSAGNASVNGLSVDISQQKRGLLRGKLNGGGPTVTLHSSASSVELSAN